MRFENLRFSFHRKLIFYLSLHIINSSTPLNILIFKPQSSLFYFNFLMNDRNFIFLKKKKEKKSIEKLSQGFQYHASNNRIACVSSSLTLPESSKAKPHSTSFLLLPLFHRLKPQR